MMGIKKGLLIICLALIQTHLKAQKDTIYVYGPGGPYPAMQAAASRFEKTNPVKIIITKGPFKNWEASAKQNADLIYSGSEDMMTGFTKSLGVLLSSTIEPLYFRRSGIVVRNGNPKNIRKVGDLKKAGIKIMVVNGSGLIGVWEDMFSKLPAVEDFRSIRRNIKVFADNSGVAEKIWNDDPSVDVWITWNIWQLKNPKTSEFIDLPEKFTVYRDIGISLTVKGNSIDSAQLFYNFLKSKEAHLIFREHGWK